MPPQARSLEDLTVDELLARAKQMEPITNLAQMLLADPDARAEVQRHVKRLNPQARIPELEMREVVDTRVKATEDQVADLRKKLLVQEAERRIERERAAIKEKYGFSDADVAEVEKLMTDKDEPIPSYGAAAKVYDASRKSATPTVASLKPPVFTMPEKDVWGAGIGNPAMLNRIGMEQAFEALNDIRSGKVAGNA